MSVVTITAAVSTSVGIPRDPGNSPPSPSPPPFPFPLPFPPFLASPSFSSSTPSTRDQSLLKTIFRAKTTFHVFLPTHPPRGAWVNRWTFSPPPLPLPPPLPPPPLPPLPSNLQICQRPLTKTWFQRPLTIETENAVSGGWRVGLSLSMRSCYINKLTFSSPPSSHIQLLVSLRYRKRCGGGVGLWLCMPSCYYF